MFKSTPRSRYFVLAAIASCCLVVAASFLVRPSKALTNNGSITALGSPLTENFDSLASSGTPAWSDNVTIPGWYSQFITNPTNPTTYATGNGGSNTGALYSFGVAGTNPVTDRALGSVGSNTTGDVYWAVKFTNNTGATITSLNVSYVGEQWRTGGTVIAQTVDFQYQANNPSVITDANTPTNNWLDYDPLDFTSPVLGTTTAGALDGNAPANRVALSGTISVTVNPGQEIWLRWKDVNHPNNDHGLAIDDLSVTANGAGPTNPTGTGSASPATVDQGGATLLTVAVTPGTNPPSTAHTVTANLSSIGGSSAQSFFDDGTHGDVTGGDNTFSFGTTVANGTTPGAKSLPVTIQETAPNSRTGSTAISLTVNTPTPPTGTGAASPSSVQAGNSSLLTVSVTSGTHPTSTGLAVTANLTAIGGSATQQFFDNGTNGDVTAGDNVFSFNATVSAATASGLKNLPAAITDAQSRSGSANIALTVTSANTSPTGTGNANPASVQIAGTTLLTVNVTPGQGPTSTGLVVTTNLSSIGGSSSQQFYDDGTNGDASPGDNVFSYTATVGLSTTLGAKSLPFTIVDDQARTGSGNIALTVTPQIVPAGSIVISQVYGGGGNAGATLTNDFIELFNRSQNAVSLAGWSVQYASAGGGGTAVWNRSTPLSGVINPGQYFLISEAAGSGGSTPLPPADVVGSIAMGATDGKVALVNNASNLPSGCPIGNSSIVDFIGYGSADCFEGAGTAQVLSNTTASFRKRGGCQDTDSNVTDFVRSAPSPRNSSTTGSVCPASGDFPPGVETTSPTNGDSGIANDANITITFDEAVNVTPNWFQISCTNTGLHPGVTTGGSVTFTIDPNVDFGSAEQCTVTINHNEVSDLDSIDPPDNMVSDFSFTFTTAIVRDPAEHMVMGNPSGAVTDVNVPLNYLMMKPQYALSYNNDKGTTNWTSWHLDNTWTTGVADRQNDFRSDDTLPISFKHVSSGYNFATYGFDRGHMCPSADRTSTVADNSATFLMTNMVPQASGNNQGPWGSLENYIRAQLGGATNELYILSGPAGVGGNSTTGHWDSILDTAGNSVTVPSATWKVVLVLPNAAGDDVARVDNATRTFAVIMPNNDNIRPDQWQKYLATVRQVETLTGYNFFSNVPQSIEDVIETRLDVVNDTAPVANGTTANTAEDNSRTITLSASDFNVNNILTFTVATNPGHGSLGSVSAPSCLNGNCTATVTYTPAANYNGPDSFTFTVNDGALDSPAAANVSINVTEVNDDPVAVNDSKTTDEDSSLNFPAGDLTTNDSAGPNEAGQTLTVNLVISTPNTHGSVVLSAGQITYTPAANYNGPASFDYQVCDDGTTNGVADSKCTIGTVNVNVESVNDNPTAGDDSSSTDEDTPVNINVLSNDSDVDNDSLSVSAVTQGAHGAVTNNGGDVTYSPAANFHGTDSFTYTVSDGHGGTATANVNVTVNSVNDNPVAVADSASTNEDNAVTIDVVANDTDVDGDSLSLASVGSASHGSVSIVSGKAVYSPAANYNGTDSFGYVVSDGHGGQASGSVSVTINPVNDTPVANSQSVATNSNTPVGITLTGSDVETAPGNLIFNVTSGPSHGVLSGVGPNRTYTPAPNYSGPDSFTFTVTDTGDGTSPALTSSEATVSITVNDTVAPVITLNGDSISLWPLNKSMRTINVSDLVAGATDNFDPNVNLSSVVIASVSSDEGTAASGDIVISGDCKSVQLRATRDGNGDGRVYTITFRARDAAGNTSFVTATVSVPHDQGSGAAIDSGAAYTVNSSCP